VAAAILDRMAEWIYFLHPPRDNFAATMTDEEQAAFAAHAQWLGRLLADGVLILAGPTLGWAHAWLGQHRHCDLRGTRPADRATHHRGGPGGPWWLRTC
jgi:hypothetical protein